MDLPAASDDARDRQPAAHPRDSGPGADGGADALLGLRLAAVGTNLPWVLLGTVAAGGVQTMLFHDTPARGTFILWFAALALVSLARLGMLLLWRDRPAARRSLRLSLLVGSGVSGLLWGLNIILFYGPADLEGRAFLLVTLAVLNTASAATLAPYLPAYLCFMLPNMAAAWAVSHMGGDFFATAMTIAVPIFTAIIMAVSRTISRAYTASFTLQIHNERLVDRLRDQTHLLRESVEEARLANRAKTEFLANVSHEVRTPVNAILGGIEILAATPLDARQAQCVRVMGTAGRTLLAQVDDLLHITRMEAGGIALETVDFDLHQRLRDVLEMIAPQAAAKGLAIGLEIGPGVPRHVSGDPARLEQVMLNLLGNAVKFTEAGAVALAAAAPQEPGRTDGRVLVRLSITDTGIGIPAAMQEAIFEPFTQADGSTTRRFGGTGLGLSISRGLVELMGGHIRVESTEGLGSTFHVELPLARALAPPASGPGGWDGVPLRRGAHTLLLVEDEPVNRYVATELLRRHGFTILEAASGAEALDLLAVRPVDAVLMDLGMPVMDGFETTARIRALPVGADVPVVALTANILPETVRRCHAAGMAGFVSKPIRMPELLRALAAVLPPADADTDAARPDMTAAG